MILAAIVSLASSVSAAACSGYGEPVLSEVEGAPDAYVIVNEVPLSQPFSLRFTVCGEVPVTGIQVDAMMPAHQHGMNYDPLVTDLGHGAFDVHGMLFHMPGIWEVRFDITVGDLTFPYIHRITLR